MNTENLLLEKLELKNFKGIRGLEVSMEGQNLVIKGDNGTGKTTVMDAFTWLLFHEDSKGQSQSHFDIKTLEDDGEPEHHLDHSVKGVFNYQGEAITFSKTFKEDWVKPRGQTDKVFEGHTVDYEVDGVPVKKSEYDEKVGEILKPSKLRLLVDPRYYNEQLHWEKRREILLGVLGDIDREDVIDESADLQYLEMGNLEPDEYRKKLKSRQSDINSKLNDIEVQIKEASRNDDPDFEPSLSELRGKLNELSSEAEATREEIAELKAQGPKTAIKENLQDVKAEMEDFASKYKSKVEDEIEDIQEKLNQELDDINRLASNYENLESKLSVKEKRIEELSDKRERLRKEYWELDERQGVCPICGQEIPEDKVDEFMNSKAGRKKEIKKNGKAAKARQDELEEEVAKLKPEMEEIKERLYLAVMASEDLQARKAEWKDNKYGYKEEDGYKSLQVEKEHLQKRLNKVDEEEPEELTEKRQELAKVENKMRKIQNKIDKAKSVERARDRVEELKDEEEELSDVYEELEQQLMLVNLYTKTKVNMLESKINDHFAVVDFKLFDRLVNGGVEPTCETLVKGVSYNNTLNTGAKIEAGLDIIDTLSQFYGVKAPVFIDHCESYTNVPDYAGSQLIKLVVSEEYPELEIQTV